MSTAQATKPLHLAPLMMPLLVLSASIAASSSCGSQGAFLRGPKAPRLAVASSQDAPYQLEAFAPTSAPAAALAKGPLKNRAVFDPFAPLDPEAPPTIEDPYGALDPFFDALRRAEAKRPDGRALIVQFGDSHTVADFGTSKLRRLLQARFGDAGRGFVLPGRPFRGYYQRDLSSGSEGNWRVENGLRLGVGAQEPFGIAGFRSIADSPQATAWVGTCKDKDCPSGASLSRFELFYHVTPQGGGLRLFVDGEPKDQISTRENYSGEDTVSGYWSTELPDGPHELSMQPMGNGPVELFGVAMERDTPGVIVDALGVGGTQAWHLAHWDWTFIGEQLKRRNPSLVIIAYGTNESANEYTTQEKIVKTYSLAIAKVRETVPNAAILVVGPIDRSVREGTDCEHSPPPSSSQLASDVCQWQTPLLIPEIVAGEREAALLSGVAFFDAYRAMGGSGTMEQWTKLDPPMGQHDHTHLTKDGYEHNAQLLYDALLTSYQEYLQSAPPL